VPIVRQSVFDGGELTPALHRRIDLAKYATGLALCRNAFPRVHGSVVNRPGTKYVVSTKDSATKKSTLFAFKYSNSQSYVIEVGEAYMRFIRNGAQIVYPSTVASVLHATQANPCVVYSGPQHVQNGDLIRFSSVGGMTQLNGNDYTVDGSTEVLAQIIGATKANPCVVYLRSSTGITTSDRAWITGVLGMTQLNDAGYALTVSTTAYTVSAVVRGSTTTLTLNSGAGLAIGDVVWLSGFTKGCYELNNVPVTLTNVAGAVVTFSVDSTNFSSYQSGGALTIAKATLTGVNSTGYGTYVSGGQLAMRKFSLLGINSTGYGVYTSGGTYQYAPSWLGAPVQITSPYLESDLDYIKYVQSFDVLTITRAGYETRELTRKDHHLWTLAVPKRGTSINPPASLTVNDSAGAGAFDYYYGVTSVDATTGEESLMREGSVLQKTGTNPNPDLSWPAVPNAIRYNIYKRTGETAASASYGFIGTTDGLAFQDISEPMGASPDRITPSTLDRPPQYSDPVLMLGFPACAAYYKQRLVYGHFDLGVQSIRLSQAGLFKNFNVSNPVRPSDAISATIASQGSQEIIHLVTLDDLIALTASGEWVIKGNADDVVSPTTINTKEHSNNGSSHVRPAIVGNTLLYVQERGTKIRDLYYSLESSKYGGNDLSLFAEHLFRPEKDGVPRTVVSMAFAQNPDSLIWCVLSDGSAASLTYRREEKIWGWGSHTTQGYYERVCVVPEGTEDVAYFICKRYLNGAFVRTIERMQTRTLASSKDGFFVDCGLSWDVPIAIGSVSWANPVVITSVAHGLLDGDLVDITGMVGATGLNDARYTVANKTNDTFELQGFDGSAMNTGYVVGSGVIRKAVTTISGLDHLANMIIAVNADGVDVGPKTVSGGGTFTLSTAASRIHAGLPFTTRVQTLDPDLSKIQFNNVGRQLNVSEVRLYVKDTKGGHVGPDVSHMEPAEFTPTYDFPTLTHTGKLDIPIDGSWNPSGSVVIEQRSPLPFELLAVVSTAEFSDVA